jgi:hypothetical protein
MDTWSEAGDEHEQLTIPILTNKKVTAHRNLIQKLEAIMASYELQEKYSTKLTPYSLQVIEKLIKTNPEFFRMVESTLLRNINDNKIMTTDVPYIISIIAYLYNILMSIHKDTNFIVEEISDTCGYILKFVFSVAVREQLVKISDETDATLLLLCCDNIIDSCIKLLKLKPLRQIANTIPTSSIIPSALPVSDPTFVPKKKAIIDYNDDSIKIKHSPPIVPPPKKSGCNACC